MKTILLLLQALMLDPDVTMPPPDKYQDLYCAYYIHPVCGNEDHPNAPDAKANDTGMLT